MKNVGSIDKIIRYVIAFVLAAIAYFYQVELGAWFWLFIVGAVVAAATALFSSCLLYKIIGISTNKTKE